MTDDMTATAGMAADAVNVTSGPTRAEVCAVACADAWRGAGEVLAHAVGSLPTIGARLAHLTHTPELVLSGGGAYFVSEHGGAGGPDGRIVEGWAPLRRIFDIVATGRRRSMMGASQLDRYGNQNISLIGPWQRPTRQLIGVRGAPGNTVNHHTDYWIPKHSRRVFVERVDVVAGVGNDRARAANGSTARFHELGVVITNLGVLDYDERGLLRLRSVHPGVTVEQVVESTGFEFGVDGATTTRLPTAEELRLIREVIDPDGARNREVPS